MRGGPAPLAAFIALALGVAAVASARAQPAAPQFAALPSALDMAAVYPPAAFNARTGGRAVITCDVAPGGGLSACVVKSEAPAGAGFGAAAQAIAAKIRLAPGDLPAQITIPLRF